MKIKIICKCGVGTEEDLSVEINLIDEKVYYYCNKCKKNYELKIGQDVNKAPYPKTRIMRDR